MSQETEIKTKSPVARRIQGEELGGAGVEEIGQDKVTLVSSSPPSGSNEDLDSLAMPIRWSEPDERPVNIFRGRNNGGSERRSPLSLQIASTLIAMSSESDNNPSSSEPDHPDNAAESADTPLNLSKK